MAELRNLVQTYLDVADQLERIKNSEAVLRFKVRHAMNDGEVVMLDKQGVAKIGDKLEIVNLR